MAVKVVTDSSCDLPPEMAQELAIVHSTTPDEASPLRERLAAILAEDMVHSLRYQYRD